MDDLTIIAVDWSGNARIAQMHGIRSAVLNDSGLDVWCDLTRADVVEELLAFPGDVVVGFDFSFGFPEWVGRCHGLESGTELWPIVAKQGETWLRDCPPPFWNTARSQQPGFEVYRRTERQNAPAMPTFKTGGKGTVGTGTLRGMPHLARLRDGGFSVWPFDPGSRRMVVEIYPRVLRPLADLSSLPRRLARAVSNSGDTRDAIASALVMWAHRNTFARLQAANDAVTKLEGKVWTPNI